MMARYVPTRALTCGALGCDETEELQRVKDGGGRTRVLCPRHVKNFLGVSS